MDSFIMSLTKGISLTTHTISLVDGFHKIRRAMTSITLHLLTTGILAGCVITLSHKYIFNVFSGRCIPFIMSLVKGITLKPHTISLVDGFHKIRRAMTSITLHLLTVGLLIGCMILVNVIFGTTRDQSHLHPIDSYGYMVSVCLYCLRVIPFLSIPFGITNILGIVLMNTYPSHPKLQHSKSAVPFLCFRVVTKGLYPELVRKTLERNIQICNKVGIDNFKFEVVTDKEMKLQTTTLVREVVVPANYTTKNKSLFKARALSYCNESHVTNLTDDDWVIHLDEETTLTEGAVVGLANFAASKHADIGQGLISYANEDVVNWVTTLMDSVRVSVDYGMMRFCFRILGRPFMGFKGSFIIVKESVEQQIGFDFGPNGSVAEDLMFALIAWSRGFKFDFVDGEVWEKSPFTIRDYLEQRKRWFVGHLFTLLSKDVPLKCKLGMIPTDLGWFLLFGNILNLPASILFPLPLPLVLNVTAGCLGGCILVMFLFGSIKSFSVRRYGVFMKVVIVISTIFVIPLAACLDAAASLYGFWTRHSRGFYIVKKETVCDHNRNGN